MPDPDSVKLRIEKLVAGGDGLAFLEGKAVFVPFALPGETLLASITARRRDYSQASIVELLEPSRHRVEPPCPIYGECGGCNLQHLSYSRQVEEKALIVGEAFSRTARVEIGEMAAVPSLPFAYRNRMQFHFTKGHRLGFMKRASSDVVEAPTCLIALRPIQDWIEERADSARAYSELGPYVLGKDRFLVFGYGDEVWVEGVKGLVEVLVAGQAIRFHVRGFFQSNLYLLDYFVPDAVDGLSGGRAADLYCGVGLFARFLAPSFDSIVCVEQNPYALELAKANVPGKGHEFSPLSVEDWVADRFGEAALRPRARRSAAHGPRPVGSPLARLGEAAFDRLSLLRSGHPRAGCGRIGEGGLRSAKPQGLRFLSPDEPCGVQCPLRPALSGA